MTYGREKRTMLGWAALLAPIPLPFNDVLEWPVLFIYVLLVIYFLQRVEKGIDRWLPVWALNLLGTAYLPILAIDLQFSLARDQAVRALMHLILFLVLVKLYSMHREREKWHVFVALFFVFVAAMGTSSHLTIFPYLLGAIAMGFTIMGRFAELHLSAKLGRSPKRVASLPSVRWPAIIACFLILSLTVPIFAMLPRLNQPFLMGQGGSNLNLSRTTGFSDRVNLNLTSEIRGNRKVAMRLQLPEGVAGEEIRLKGASYTYYRRQNWFRPVESLRNLFPTEDDSGRVFVLPGANLENTRRATIFLEPINSAAAILPTTTHAVRPGIPLSFLRLDSGGALLFPGSSPPEQMVQYEVELGDGEFISAAPPSSNPRNPASRPPSLDIRGISPRLTELAKNVMGEGTDNERAGRLLTHLINEYSYTTDFVGRDGKQPIEDFLFEYRSGHCELFASSMVLLLRSQDIPARLVTGFLGAELNPIEGYYVVRQQNAHAWVEAWVDGRWQVYDPTPPDGRPAVAKRDLKLLLQQIYDYVAFRWDRYVLTYGSADQQSVWQTIREQATELWESWRRWRREEARRGSRAVPSEEPNLPTAGLEQGEELQALWQDPKARYAGSAVILSILIGTIIWLRRRTLPATEIYIRLRRGVVNLGLPVDDTTAPLELRRLLVELHPQTRDDVHLIIDAYVRQSFAGQAATDSAEALRPALSRVLARIRQDLKAAKKVASQETRRAA